MDRKFLRQYLTILISPFKEEQQQWTPVAREVKTSHGPDLQQAAAATLLLERSSEALTVGFRPGCWVACLRIALAGCDSVEPMPSIMKGYTKRQRARGPRPACHYLPLTFTLLWASSRQADWKLDVVMLNVTCLLVRLTNTRQSRYCCEGNFLDGIKICK